MNKIVALILLFGFFSCKNQPVMPSADTNEVDQPAVEQSAAPKPESSSVAQQAPEYLNVALQGYQTPNINLNEFYGEVIFINFWGSWCPPCKMEMPSIQALYNDYKDKVKFVTIAFEKQAGAYKPFIEENGYSFPVYEAVSPMSSELKPQGFPTTLILNKKGEILIKDIGAKDWNANDVREKLDALLNE